MGDEFKVRCVRPNNNEDDNESSEFMLKAIQNLKKESFHPVWMTPDQCMSVTKKEKNCVYLFDPFEGKAFDYIKSLGCRILGPQCILESLEYKLEIPRRPYPVYNLAMKDTVVCCTSLEKNIRESLHIKIELMGGTVSKDFTEQVTHLVAGEVGSKKYQVAASLSKQIMLQEWISKVWEISQQRHVHATDAAFQDYRCPLFKGLVVTVSGLDPDERNEVKKLVMAEGGQYSGEMKVNECTHLIINKPKGTKYEFAKKWKIHIIKSDWLYDSIEKGFCLDEANFRVESEGFSQKSQVKTSTPEKDAAPVRVSSIADISCINNVSVLSNINETAAPNQARKSLMDDVDNSLNAIDLTQCPSDFFLDGCKIYLSGFRGQALEKLRKVINAGGGTRLNQLSENVTHVIVGEKIDKDINFLKSAAFRPQVVSMQWLAECYKQGQTVEEEPFHCLDLPAPDVSTSPSFKGKKKPSGSVNTDLKNNRDLERTASEGDDHQDDMDIMSQYLLQADQGVPTPGEPTVVEQNNTSLAAAGPPQSVQDEMTQDTNTEAAMAEAARLAGDVTDQTNDETVESEVDGIKQIFRKKTFMFFGFDDEPVTDLPNYVTERGGKVLSGNIRLVPDYGVVPIDGFPISRTVTDVVTNAWLQMCLEQDALLTDNNELYSPLDIVMDIQPLDSCVLSVSGYSGVERDCLMQIGELLGARCQEYFVRKANKGLEPSTHLVVREASGSKYEAAKKWGIPAVSKRWLLACARTGIRESEEKYHIDRELLDMTASQTQNQDVSVYDESRHTTPPEELVRAPAEEAVDAAGQEECPAPVKTETPTKTDPDTRTDCDKTVSPDPKTVSPDRKTISPDPKTFSPDLKTVLPDPKTVSPNLKTISPDPKENGGGDNISADISLKQISKDEIKQKPFQDSQKENLQHTTVTPVQSKLVNNRIKALQDDEMDSTPLNKSRNRSGINTPSPGRFLDPSREFQPVFDLADAMKALDTPVSQKPRTQRKASKRRSSLPLEDMFTKHIEDAVKISAASTAGTSKMDEVDGMVQQIQIEQEGPMKGVVIAVSKKLSSQQPEFNNIVSALGGDYRWTYDSSCTHFIFQGRTNDLTKEFRMARDQGKIIVSPHWLHMCKEQNAHVDESLFPHNYNPNLTLSVVSGKKLDTPSRSTRRSVRSASSKACKTDSGDDMPNRSRKKSEVNEEVQKKEKSENLAEETCTKDMEQNNTDDNDEAENKDEKPSNETNAEQVETGGTLELREVLSKQLENMMAVSKNKKNSKRKSKKLNSSGQLSTSGEASSGGQNNSRPPSRQNRWSLQEEEAGSERRFSRSTSKQQKDSHSGPEASQSVQITWDDPTGRLEEEKLAHKLERAYSPTQDAGMHDYQDGEFSDVEDDSKPVPNLPHYDEVEQKKDDRVLTPEHPALAFPKPRNTSKVEAPQPIDIKDDGDEDVEEEDAVCSLPPVFILSGIAQEERDHYGALVEQLGGKMSDGQQYDPACTHLIIGVPSRNEKFLACVASGKWVLHKSYFEACRQEGKFVQEDFYEWGGDGTSSLLTGKNSQVTKLAVAAHNWRLKVSQSRKELGSCPGAFDGWKVLLLADQGRESSFRRLLEAGGATVLNNKSANFSRVGFFVGQFKVVIPSMKLFLHNTRNLPVVLFRPPFPKKISATHAFIELNKVPISEDDLECLICNGVLCLRPDFIAAHLTDNPSPQPGNFCPPEIEALRTRSSEESGSKRKVSSSSSSESRSKRTRKH